MINKDIVYQVINSFAIELGFFIVDIIIKPGNKIMIFIDNHKGISIEECAFINKKIKSLLNRDIENYELFVSSPGLDKPFKVKEQYIKNIGKNIEIKTINGDKKQGILLEVNNTGIVLEYNEKSKKTCSERFDRRHSEQVELLTVSHNRTIKQLVNKSFAERYFIEFNNIQQAKAVILFK
ncbi:MAG: ribosome assembly cofactor RimP [Bacteroidia bacterium]|nr:ribosome assembly cofactor RimP [Bacteroidia bacterium]